MRIFSFTRISAVAKKEFNHLRRDRLTGGMIAGIPIVMTILFGYAINNDVRNLKAVVVDEANTSASREMILNVSGSQVIELIGEASSPHEIEQLIASGEVSIGLFFPANFEERRAQNKWPLAQIIVDDSDPTIFNTARALLNMPFGTFNQGNRMTLFEVRSLYNPERRSPVFIVPGLCGVILTLTMVLFTSIALVRERERGNLELLITTPIHSLELMIGKIIPYIIIGYIQITIIISLGMFLFNIPVRGDLLDFYLGSGVFIISILTLGLLISTFAESQFQAFQMTFMSFLPQLLLSGFMFPFEGMPKQAQWLSELFPLTHFLRIVRGVILRDASIDMLIGDIWPLVIFFLIVITLATLRFRKRLD